MFQRGIEDGSLRPDLDVDLSISQFIYTLRTVVERALSQAYAFAAIDADAYFEHFLDLFVHGIRS